MNTKEGSQRPLREAKEDLERANVYFDLKDWVTVIHYSQLAIEKSAKAVISCFESFEWTHDPSEQLKRLIKKGYLSNEFQELAEPAREAAPWHGRCTSGALINGTWKSPSEICSEEVTVQLLDKARKSVDKVDRFIEAFFKE